VGAARKLQRWWMRLSRAGVPGSVDDACAVQCATDRKQIAGGKRGPVVCLQLTAGAAAGGAGCACRTCCRPASRACRRATHTRCRPRRTSSRRPPTRGRRGRRRQARLNWRAQARRPAPLARSCRSRRRRGARGRRPARPARRPAAPARPTDCRCGRAPGAGALAATAATCPWRRRPRRRRRPPQRLLRTARLSPAAAGSAGGRRWRARRCTCGRPGCAPGAAARGARACRGRRWGGPLRMGVPKPAVTSRWAGRGQTVDAACSGACHNMSTRRSWPVV